MEIIVSKCCNTPTRVLGVGYKHAHNQCLSCKQHCLLTIVDHEDAELRIGPLYV